ncbi:hypothetical protein [Salinilacihabitans rarus]|uniref:hypothetical protein n=1 Tax=Salinilacihabitans rarus TaxID=2961596 RepID=UPI0020C90A35|nr:hypothetical protein [Salinilacihabitans rarus]
MPFDAPAVVPAPVDATVVVAVVVTGVLLATIAFVVYLAFAPYVTSGFGDPAGHAASVQREGANDSDDADREDADPDDAADGGELAGPAERE